MLQKQHAAKVASERVSVKREILRGLKPAESKQFLLENGHALVPQARQPS
jgi:hypothetical protein